MLMLDNPLVPLVISFIFPFSSYRIICSCLKPHHMHPKYPSDYRSLVSIAKKWLLFSSESRILRMRPNLVPPNGVERPKALNQFTVSLLFFPSTICRFQATACLIMRVPQRFALHSDLSIQKPAKLRSSFGFHLASEYEKDGFAFLTDRFVSSETVLVNYFADAKCEILIFGHCEISRLRGK